MNSPNLSSDPHISILPFEGIEPQIHPTVFLCDGVRIVGDVSIGAHSSIWFNTVIRGDVHHIRIGEHTNVQDLCMLHVTHKKYSLNIGSHVTIGHSAVLHGATIHDTCLIGMGAKVLDRSIIGSNSIVAAGAVVREGFEVPEGVLAAGVPAKIIRPLKAAEIEQLTRQAAGYKSYVERYRAGGAANPQNA